MNLGTEEQHGIDKLPVGHGRAWSNQCWGRGCVVDQFDSSSTTQNKSATIAWTDLPFAVFLKNNGVETFEVGTGHLMRAIGIDTMQLCWQRFHHALSRFFIQ